MKPSGPRVVYYALLAWRRQAPQEVIELEAKSIDEAVERRFLGKAGRIARNLAADFKRAIDMLEDPTTAAQRFLKEHPLLNAPRFPWTHEHLTGIHEPLRQRWQKLWKTAWEGAEPEHQARLLHVLKEDQLLVVTVARPAASEDEGLAALRQRLDQDKTAHRWIIPPADIYLFEEPLDEWLLRPVLTGKWFFRLCEALASLTREVATQVAQRAAEVGEKNKRAVAEGRPSGSREVPPMPQGTVTAEILFYYAVAAYRAGLPADAGDAPILRDGQRIPLAQFQQLVALAIQIAEQLLWPDPLHGLPAQSPERTRLLREGLLPRRLRREYESLRRKGQWRRGQAAPPPPWLEWETPLHTTIALIDRRLTSSVSPEQITSVTLDDLLLLPHAALVESYHYQMPVGEWLRAALPKDLLNAVAFLDYCRAVVEPLGPWPQTTYGAPANTEQASLAVFWYAKLRLETVITDLPGSPPSSVPAAPPHAQTQASRWLLWLTSESLPAEALELITVLAPLIARMLFLTAWEAADQNKPLFVARLREGDAASVDTIHRRLQQQAYALGHQSGSDAVREAWEKLQKILDRLVLPADVTMSLLAGESKALAALDILESFWYSKYRSDYEFIGSIDGFSSRMIRPPIDSMVTRSTDRIEDDDGPYEKPEDADHLNPNETTHDILYEERSVLKVVALIVQAAQNQPNAPAPETLQPEDALLLVRGMLITHTGRALVGAFVHQGARAAVEVIRLWTKHWATPAGATQETLPWTETVQLMYNVALARFLASGMVQGSPEMRRVASDLFEIPTKRSPKEPPLVLLLGTQERVAARIYDPDRRRELLQVLQALEDVPTTQRQALCAQLLAQAWVIHLLALLEHEGWVRPPWLAVPTPGRMQDSQASEESDWMEEEEEEEETDSEPDELSRAIFLVGRKRWLAELAKRALNAQARALPFELLGIFFWGRSWVERLDGEPVASFYRTLMNALHPRLRAVLRAAWLTAYRQKLSTLPELLGLVGCLPPQLPAQLDHRPFFEAMYTCLFPHDDQDHERSAENAGTLSPTLRRLRQDLITARTYTSAWFLALAGLVEDNERKLLFAAFSLAGNQIERVGQWIEGQPPSPSEAQALLVEVRRWHQKSTITEENIEKFWSAAAEAVRPVWRQLRSVPQS